MVPSATRWLLDHGADRLAYVDLDAHHGDGVERVFWGDPRVLTISLHESGLHLFPHTGFPREVGGAGRTPGARPSTWPSSPARPTACGCTPSPRSSRRSSRHSDPR
ncbi:hypothetical protein [Propioniciclava sinopodophylli]|uniref:hypothetical protein n=1 Tax=Propioniciclava sinopodophylli TaxID=1837344 RepID=UPI00248FD941|nr:hypothetical protein [Propioniciclava sinopodophylli]